MLRRSCAALAASRTQVELVVQVVVELGDHLARLQALAVGRQPLDPARQRAHQREVVVDRREHAGPQHLDRDLAAVAAASRSAPARSRRWPPARRRSCAKTASIGRPKARSTSARATVGRERRHAVLQLGELVGEVGRQQVAPRRQHLAELDEDRPEALERRGAAARRAARRGGGRSSSRAPAARTQRWRKLDSASSSSP